MDKHNERTTSALLYWQGYKVPEIASKFNLKEATVYSWKKRDNWDTASPARKVEIASEAKMLQIIMKTDPTVADLALFDMLLKAIETTAKIKQYQRSGKGKALNPKLGNRGRKSNQSKNELDDDALEKMEEAFRSMFQDYLYQWELVAAWHQYDILNLLKSRQIGLTFFWALFAILHAAKTGDNWVFLSASKRQALIFKRYIVKFVRSVTTEKDEKGRIIVPGIELKGDPLSLPNGAELHFLSTNTNTSQGEHGHLVVDEYQWIQKFATFQAATSGMALHSQWHEVYLTTPSNTQHDGWAFWDGSHFNKGRPKSEHINIDISHKALKEGRLCEDGHYRQIINIEDAVAKGCKLFNLEKLKLKYSTDVYNNLLMCQPVDSTQGIFSLAQMQACGVDTFERWFDFEPLAKRPFGDRPVWIGYDPSRRRDDAACVVIAPPEDSGNYRILERFSWDDMAFTDQAHEIEKLTKKYRVTHIGVDTSGIGEGVFDLIKVFYPAAKSINYSINVKNRLVLKAMHLIGKKRLKYDAGWNDISLSFMMIRQGVTPSGIMTYQADRNAENGHADLAWAVMHALDAVKLTKMVDSKHPSGQSILEFYD